MNLASSRFSKHFYAMKIHSNERSITIWYSNPKTHWWLRLWWWYIDAAVVSLSAVDEPHSNRAFYAPSAPVLITDSLYWNVFSSWTEYIQWQKVAGPAWPLHGCIGPKNVSSGSCSRTSHQPSQITASCIFRPPNHVPASIDRLPNICQSQIALFSSSFLLFLRLWRICWFRVSSDGGG